MNSESSPPVPPLNIQAQLAYRDVVTQKYGYAFPAVQSAQELIALAKSIDANELEAERGWRSEPPFPGAGSAPQQTPNGGWMMICATRLFQGAQPFGVMYFTLASGRPTSTYVGAPETTIPADYTILR